MSDGFVTMSVKSVAIAEIAGCSLLRLLAATGIVASMSEFARTTTTSVAMMMDSIKGKSIIIAPAGPGVRC